MTPAAASPSIGARPWGAASLQVGETRSLDLGTLRLVIRRTTGEVWLQSQRSPKLHDPDEGEWQRWAAPRESGLVIRPAMPDRLIVVSHEHGYHLPPRREAKVYVRIPLFVQVAIAEERSETTLVDLPSIVLSDTWWGTFTEGELAYWLTTKARVAVADDLFLPHVGMCPLRLVNESADSLPIERFALQAAHLSLFSDGRKNWTDEVRVIYEDSPEGSEIRFAERPPEEATGAELLAPPRVGPARGLHTRTFDRLKSLSTLGL
jgi:hypothetical protein